MESLFTVYCFHKITYGENNFFQFLKVCQWKKETKPKQQNKTNNMNHGLFHTRIHLQNPSKLTEKQTDKVRRIVHPKLRPIHFQIKTCYLSDAIYPTA